MGRCLRIKTPRTLYPYKNITHICKSILYCLSTFAPDNTFNAHTKTPSQLTSSVRMLFAPAIGKIWRTYTKQMSHVICFSASSRLLVNFDSQRFTSSTTPATAATSASGWWKWEYLYIVKFESINFSDPQGRRGLTKYWIFFILFWDIWEGMIYSYRKENGGLHKKFLKWKKIWTTNQRNTTAP